MTDPDAASAEPNERALLHRSLMVLGLVALFLAAGLLLWNALDIFLLAFVAVLLAIFLNTPAHLLSSRTRISHGLALALVVTLLLGLAVAIGFLAGPSVVDQARQLTDRLPDSLQQVREQVRNLPGGEWILERMPSGEDAEFSGSGMISQITGTASLFWEALAKVLFVLFLGLYLAASPRAHRDGLATLVPPAGRERAVQVLDRIGRALQGWLLGQLVAMLAVGVMVWLGLTLLGMPLALILGLTAGLFDFVPIVGPVLAFVPAVLVAFTQGTNQVLWVILLYVVIQQIESHLVMPLAQRKTIDLPPALTISAVFIGAALFGPLGLLIGAPLAAVLLVLISMLYRHDLLGEHVELPAGGEE